MKKKNYLTVFIINLLKKIANDNNGFWLRNNYY